MSAAAPPRADEADAPGCGERQRVALLAATGLLDTPASEGFDRITRLAAQLFGVPIALVSLVDETRQWFKSNHGLDASETARDVSFCSHAIEQRAVMVVEDALLDPRFADNPLVRGEPGIRFYAGAPLVLASGHALGALCIIDRVPRRLDADARARLADLAAMVMTQIELHQRAGLVSEVTRLPNRARLAQDLEALRAARPGERRALMLLDVMDHALLQSAVRAVGIRPLEASLREIARKLQALLDPGTTLYHLSETRFGFLLPRADRAVQDVAAARLLAAMREPFSAGGVALDLGVHAGLVDFALAADENEDVLRKATSALHESITQRRGPLWHAAGFDEQHRHAYTLLRHVPTGLAAGQFRLVYQPKFNLNTGRYSGVEALARWTHPRFGEVSPAEFIPLVESTALIHAFTAWVIDAALGQLRTWHDEGLDLTVAVNVSSRNLEDDGFVEAVGAACARHGVHPRRLHIECTEHSVMTSATTHAALESLRAMGIRISLDDFGMGFSNLACLSALPVHLLKLDRSLIAPVSSSERALLLVRSLIGMGHALGYRMLAEGVEDQATYDLLVAAGCDALQGFFLSRPLPPSQLVAFLAAQPATPRHRPSLPHAA